MRSAGTRARVPSRSFTLPTGIPRTWRSLLPLLGTVVLGLACDRTPASREALYGTPTNPPPAEPVTHRASLRPDTGGGALLTAVQTELFPATLWHGASDTMRLFADLPATGLGGPTFLAYSSPTGIAILRPGSVFTGDQLRENWLLTGFAGADGWTEWDSPWAAFLERRPQRVALTNDALHLTFPGPAGHVALMPLYGYYKPPQKGHEFLASYGLEEKELLTWEWSIAVARDPLTRLRYWAGATRHFPYQCRESLVVDRRRNAVILTEEFESLEIPDAWGTAPIRLAPVSPTLGLALVDGQSFPVKLSKKAMDFALPTPFGPWFAAPNAASYEVTLPVLQYVNETEAPALPVATNAPPVVRAALERLQSTASERFDSPDPARNPTQSDAAFRSEILSSHWYAQALPYLPSTTRTHAVAALRKFLAEEALITNRLAEQEIPTGSGVTYLVVKAGNSLSSSEPAMEGGLNAGLLQFLWAYAHFSGDHSLIHERWPLIRKLFLTPARISWAGFGPHDLAPAGDAPFSTVAFARLAYLAGDLNTYHVACGIFAKELLHHYVRERATPWFRRNQPWHSMEPIPPEARLIRLDRGLTGWQLESPQYPQDNPRRSFDLRWGRFQDLDVARFHRDVLLKDARLDLGHLMNRWEASRRHTDDGHNFPSLVRLHSLLLNATTSELAAIATPDQFEGTPSGIIASCLAVLRSSRPPQFERLIPSGDPSTPIPSLGLWVQSPNADLVQHIAIPEGKEASWPRITWPEWRTPTGAAWNFGEVRAGTNDLPPGTDRVVLNQHALQFRVQSVDPPPRIAPD